MTSDKGWTRVSDYVVSNRTSETSMFTHRLVCHDGFHVSVQASSGHYCEPRHDNEPDYWEFELGYPSEEMGEAFKEYADNPEQLLDTVYAYVPVELIQSLVDSHGGIKGQYNDEEASAALQRAEGEV